MKSEIIENILKSDFESQAQIQGFETFSLEAVQKLRDVEKFLMNKSLTEELSEEENIQLDICKGEISTLSVTQVINDNTLKKEHIFYRHNDLEKGGHKYFKREGTPGNYKYYYTEAQYKKEKSESEGGEKKDSDYEKMSNSDKAQFHREKMEEYNKKGDGAKYHYHMGKRDEFKTLASKESENNFSIQEKDNKILLKKNKKVVGYVTKSKDGGYAYNIGKPSDVSVSTFTGKDKPLTKDEALERLKNATNI